jgi:hypothetical protein
MTEGQGAAGNRQGKSPDKPLRFGVFLWRYRRTINRELLRQQLAAVRTNDSEGYARVQSYVAIGLDGRERPGRPMRAKPADSADRTSYERRLDSWRIVITFLLVLALFTLMIIIILKSINPGTATPYVSLLSGLVGIALGWMFATASQGRQGLASGPGTSSATPAAPAPATPEPATPEPATPEPATPEPAAPAAPAPAAPAPAAPEPANNP